MYPQIDKFTEKLNKIEGKTYVIEEEVILTNGVYEGELEHDNASNSSVRVYTGTKLTGEKLENFILSTPSSAPWKREIKIFATVNKAYITYETTGDTIEAEDINKAQESLVNTQKALNSEVERATKSEESLNKDLKEEIVRAKKAEEKLTNDVNETNKNLNNEVTRAKTSEQNLLGGLNAEITRAKSAETTISNDLSSYKTSNNAEIQILESKGIELEDKKANKTYVYTELNKRYLKEQVFTKDEVLQKIQDVIGTAPEALDTLQEIAKALNNDANFAGTMTNELSKKVDKVQGKQLSTEDFTTVEKTKLAGIEQGANKYIHPSGTNPHGTTKGDVGLSNVDNIKQATKAEFDAHAADSIKHITTTERTTWNGKANAIHTHDDRYFTEIEANSKFATKADLGSAGYGDMLKSVYDKNNNGKIDVAEIADSVPWAGVTGKPSTFNPNSHTHTLDNVTGLQSALDGKMNKGAVTWNNLKGV